MITRSHQFSLPNQALLFDLEALYEQLQHVRDHRDRRGVRYPLADILLIGVLAKLAGQTSSRAMARLHSVAPARIAFAVWLATSTHATLQYLESSLGVSNRSR
ncbi:transposase family protein [Ktedonobacter sp. SOSP1-52]|uniref:transposase family protein n=1 Tax=Ktedonobacter sp. SOSP1-52 TaxID=2778366 RepID=UPI00191505FA|nr:transposase family protein [Ktedonobacter sp. SOSP1-52]